MDHTDSQEPVEVKVESVQPVDNRAQVNEEVSTPTPEEVNSAQLDDIASSEDPIEPVDPVQTPEAEVPEQVPPAETMAAAPEVNPVQEPMATDHIALAVADVPLTSPVVETKKIPNPMVKIIAIVAVVVILLLVVGYFAMSRNSSSSKKSTSTAPTTFAATQATAAAKDPDVSSSTIDSSLSKIDDTKDFGSDTLSDTALGL